MPTGYSQPENALVAAEAQSIGTQYVAGMQGLERWAIVSDQTFTLACDFFQMAASILSSLPIDLPAAACGELHGQGAIG